VTKKKERFLADKQQRLDSAIDKLANLFENGHLMASTDPETLLDLASEEIKRRRCEKKLTQLPDIWLTVRGDVFEAKGVWAVDTPPISWSIYAEAESATAARTRIKITDQIVADLTIHASDKSQLPDEVQEIASAIVWSAIRCKVIKKKGGK